MFFQFEQRIPRLTTLTSSATELTILAQVFTNRRIEVIYNAGSPGFTNDCSKLKNSKNELADW